jgi:hypothetical protein
MLIGESVTYEGRLYVVVGFTPMSVHPAEIQLHDPATNQTMWVEWPRSEPVGRAAMRVVPNDEATGPE